MQDSLSRSIRPDDDSFVMKPSVLARGSWRGWRFSYCTHLLLGRLEVQLDFETWEFWPRRQSLVPALLKATRKKPYKGERRSSLAARWLWTDNGRWLRFNAKPMLAPEVQLRGIRGSLLATLTVFLRLLWVYKMRLVRIFVLYLRS